MLIDIPGCSAFWKDRVTRRCPFASVLALLVALGGCSNSPEKKTTNKPVAQKQLKKKNTTDFETKPKGNEKLDEKLPESKTFKGQALEKVVLMLDSWSFGDLPDNFRAKHPEIKVVESTWSSGRLVGVKLLRYEIRSVREAEKAPDSEVIAQFEFLVSLQFKNGLAGDSENRRYLAMKTQDNSWEIVSLGSN